MEWIGIGLLVGVGMWLAPFIVVAAAMAIAVIAAIIRRVLK